MLITADLPEQVAIALSSGSRKSLKPYSSHAKLINFFYGIVGFRLILKVAYKKEQHQIPADVLSNDKGRIYYDVVETRLQRDLIE